MKSNPVIGYVAYKSPTELFCDGPSCLVVGSEEKMKSLLSMRGLIPGDFSIRKTRFEDILRGLTLGGAYGFEEEAYARFAPAGVGVGIPKTDFDFTPSEPGKVKLLSLKIK
jgi:hypothetical protein